MSRPEDPAPAEGEDQREPVPGEPPPWRRRTRKTPEERRHSLLEAAADLITSEGFDHVTMEAITARAGVSKALGYFYFNRLEDLLHELFTREFEAVYLRLVPALTEPGTLEERIRRKVAAYFDVVGERRDLFSELNTHLRGPEYRRERQERFRLWERYVADLVEAEFDVSGAVSRLVARLLMVIDERCVNIWLRDELPRDQVEELCVQFQLAGLREVLGSSSPALADGTSAAAKGTPSTAGAARGGAKRAGAKTTSAKKAAAKKSAAKKSASKRSAAKRANGAEQTGAATEPARSARS